MVAGVDGPNMDKPFTIDHGCVGVRSLGHGRVNGYLLLDPNSRTFTKVGCWRPALLVSTQGFSGGQHYWEFLDLVDSTTAKVSFGIGVVPQADDSSLSVDSDIQQNGGHGAVLTHGDLPGGTKHGDRIGVLLDLTGESGRLSFFLNGHFAGIPSLTGLASACPWRPCFCATGSEGVECRFEVSLPPRMPDLAAHADLEQRHLEQRSAEEAASAAAKEVPAGGLTFALALTPEEEAHAVKVAMAHTGGTLEISSQVRDEIQLRPGDAVLFVDLAVRGSGARWIFGIDDERVLARDVLYQHVEFDLNVHQAGIGGGVGLKVAHKFVALKPGQTSFCSRHARPSAVSKEWDQTLRINVVNRQHSAG